MSFIYVAQVYYKDSKHGKARELPCIVTESGVLISHLCYLNFHYSHKSQSWISKSTHAVRLLIKWIQVNDGEFKTTVKLLESFVNTLSTGTIDYETIDDPTGLYWKPRQATDVNIILRQITQYTDWLAKQKGFDENRSNPWREATTTEQRLAWCAWYHKKDNCLLGHLMTHDKGIKAVAKARQVTAPRPAKVEQERLFRFPETRINDLLYKGMVKSYTHSKMPDTERLDWKTIAITLLMHYGGLRISEVFHIWMCDITLNPNNNKAALVRVYHPAYGQSPDPQYTNRQEYLDAMCAMQPRHTYSFNSKLFAGWKIPVLTDSRQFFEVFFAPEESAQWFLQAWINYLKYQRVEPPKDRPHPYAFTNKNGDPETIGNFKRLYQKAVNNIGLESARYNGTTEHSHRHSYGYRLAGMGFDERLIQKAMHHNNPKSCLVYVQHTNEDIRLAIQDESVVPRIER